MFFSILPHLRMVELNQEGGSVSWFGVKRNFKWKELEVITYGDIGVVRGERWEGIFFSNKALTAKRQTNDDDRENLFFLEHF